MKKFLRIAGRKTGGENPRADSPAPRLRKFGKNWFFLGMLAIFCGIFGAGSLVLAQENQGRGRYGSDPSSILEKVVDEANDEGRIQDSPLERISTTQGGFDPRFRITNTLDSIRVNMAFYLQWIVFIGLSLAVIGLIVLGAKAVLGLQDGTAEKIKKGIIDIVIGVVILTGFYGIVTLISAIFSAVFGTAGGGSGF